MFTIFASQKNFEGQFQAIQRNAITSWTLLEPKPEIILFGKAKGTSDICQELGLKYVPGLSYNQFGRPLVSDLFEKAQKLSGHELMCYVNSDVILMQSLIQALEIVRSRWKRFVIICSIWNLAVQREIDFISTDWKIELCDLLRKEARAPISGGIDLFLFPKGFYTGIPPFALGGVAWDSWLIFKARSANIPLIDVSKFACIIHQDHQGTTHSIQWENKTGLDYNRQLTSWWISTFAGFDAPYVLEQDGRLRKKGWPELISPRISNFKARYILNSKIWLWGHRMKRKLVSSKQKI